MKRDVRKNKRPTVILAVVCAFFTFIIFCIMIGVNLNQRATFYQETQPRVDDDSAWIISKTEIGYDPIIAEQIEYNAGFWSGYEVETETNVHISVIGLYLLLSLILAGCVTVVLLGIKSLF